MSASIAIAPRVELGERPLSKTWGDALVEVRVERRFLVPARCTLRFSDPGYTLSKASTVQLGTKIDVAVPPPGSEKLMSGEVTDIALEQRPGDHPELVITGYDKSYRLGRSTMLESYDEMSLSDVAAKLAESCSLAPATDPTALRLKDLLQIDSALGLLTELARRAGFDWWVEGNTLNFKKPALDGSVSLTLGGDLLSFSARATGHYPNTVTVQGWDRVQQANVMATASSATEAVKSASEFASKTDKAREGLGEAKLITGGVGAHSDTEAKELSQALLDRAVGASVSAEGVAEGNGRIKLAAAVEVSNAGPLSGKYPVTRVEHLFRAGRGFTTRFWAGERRPATLVDTLVVGGALGGAATWHPAIAIGQVTSLKDPDKLGRVRLKFPGLSSQLQSAWARVVAAGGGKARGALFLPEVDDEVLVAFEGGDFRQPVVIGGLYGREDGLPNKSATLVDDGEGTLVRRGLYSRLDNAVEILDGTSEPQQAIELRLGGGEHKIHLGKDKLAVNVPASYAVEVMAGETSIKIGTDGSVKISAPQVSINAEEKFSVNAPEISLIADAKLSLTTEGAAMLTGDTIMLQSEGPLSAEGEPIMLN